MTNRDGLLRCEPGEHSDRIYGKRPPWVQGHISHHDARFLFAHALRARSNVLIELGTASGVSTSILCHAAYRASAAGEIGSDFRVHSYDIDTHFYADRSRRVGDAAIEMLEDELIGHVTFHSTATAANVRDHHSSDSIGFAFIDASHKHPWPTLDLLAMLICLRPGGTVLLHDINLPRREDGALGAQLLFEELEVEKDVDRGIPLPNIGSIKIPNDKAGLREQLVALVDGHEWEVEPHPHQVQVALSR